MSEGRITDKIHVEIDMASDTAVLLIGDLPPLPVSVEYAKQLLAKAGVDIDARVH